MTEKKHTIYLLSSTHWDREWYQTFQGFRYRLVEVTNGIIDTLEGNPDFNVFHFDGQTVVLEDYSEIEPEKKERLAALIRAGRLLVGPWYVMPDEFLLSGESLIRNLMRGHRIAEEWGGEPWKYGYICDIFGHIAQMPQIFNGFGIRYALLGRGTNEHSCPAHFLWQAPDGSQCITFKLEDVGGYGSFCIRALGWNSRADVLSKEELYKQVREHVEGEMKRSPIPVTLLADGIDHEPIHGDTPEYLRMIGEMFPDAEVRHVNLVEMGKQLENYRGQMPVKPGELNETAKKKGGYIHLITHTLSSRYPIKKANDRCQTLLEKWVEPLTAVSRLRGFDTQKTYVNLAYKHLLQNHPHDSICGCSIDQVHKDMEYRFNQCEMIGQQLITAIMNNERDRHPSDPAGHTRVMMLWNPLPFPRREVITVEVDFHTDYPEQYQEPFGYELKNSFKIFDCHGKEVPYSLVSMKKNYNVRRFNQYVEKVNIHTLSLEVEVPAMGTAEYRIVPWSTPSRYLDTLSKDERKVENEYIRLSINDNGTLKIFDKRSGKTYDQLMSYLDDGEIGDGWYHANPVEDVLIGSHGAPCTIERVENGPVRTVFRITHFLQIPCEVEYHTHGIRRSAERVNMEIQSLVGLSKGADRVDIRTTVKNNARDHRLRLKLPTGIGAPVYFANQAFAFVERKTGIDTGTQEWKECEVPEKQMGGIVGKRGADGSGLAFVSAYGLHECAGLDDPEGSLVVTLFRSFRKTVMTNGEEGGQIQGSHTFQYELVPMQPETTYAHLTRLQDALQAGMQAASFRVPDDYELPQPRSYFALSGDHICLSVLKRPENDEKDWVIFRLYNMSAEVSTASIRSFLDIREAAEVNLNEEFIRDMVFDKNSLEVSLGPWKIGTYLLKLKAENGE